MTDTYEDAKARVLAYLKAQAPEKVSTWTLIHATHHSRAVGRIWELVKDGHAIEHTRDGRVHFWRYRGAQQARQAELF